MKSFLAIILTFATLTSYARSGYLVSCDSPTDNHPALQLKVDSMTTNVTITIEENDGTVKEFNSMLTKTQKTQLGDGLLTTSIFLIAAKAESFVSGNKDFFGDAITLHIQQKVPKLSGSQIITLTNGKNVTKHSCASLN